MRRRRARYGAVRIDRCKLKPEERERLCDAFRSWTWIYALRGSRGEVIGLVHSYGVCEARAAVRAIFPSLLP